MTRFPQIAHDWTGCKMSTVIRHLQSAEQILGNSRWFWLHVIARRNLYASVKASIKQSSYPCHDANSDSSLGSPMKWWIFSGARGRVKQMLEDAASFSLKGKQTSYRPCMVYLLTFGCCFFKNMVNVCRWYTIPYMDGLGTERARTRNHVFFCC